MFTFKEYFKKYPWAKVAMSINARCAPSGKYYLKGIKTFLTVEKIKTLWFRDKAYLMKKPSLHRIDNKKDYTIENCQFIELKDHRKKSTQELINTLSKPVAQFKDGKLIRIFPSRMEASRVMGVDAGSIHKAIKKSFKVCGYTWTEAKQALKGAVR